MVDKRRFDPAPATSDLALRAQFVKSRRVVRFVGDDGSTSELPLLEFLDRLGIDPVEVAPPRHYVVFGGRDDRPVGGTGDIAGTFGDEDEARALFQRLRTSREYVWAQLVSLDARGRARAICWFGDRFHHNAATPAASGTSAPASRRRSLRRLAVIAGGDARSLPQPFTTGTARGALRREG